MERIYHARHSLHKNNLLVPADMKKGGEEGLNSSQRFQNQPPAPPFLLGSPSPCCSFGWLVSTSTSGPGPRLHRRVVIPSTQFVPIIRRLLLLVGIKHLILSHLFFFLDFFALLGSFNGPEIGFFLLLHSNPAHFIFVIGFSGRFWAVLAAFQVGIDSYERESDKKEMIALALAHTHKHCNNNNNIYNKLENQIQELSLAVNTDT